MKIFVSFYIPSLEVVKIGIIAKRAYGLYSKLKNATTQNVIERPGPPSQAPQGEQGTN